MATKIRGITIELGMDASGVASALQSVNSKISATGRELKDVDRLLKLDPHNTELLEQKTKLLQEQISNTREKIEALKKAQETMDANGVDKNSSQYQALQREIIAAERDLEKLERTAGSGSAALAKISTVTGEIGEKMESAGKKMSVVSAGIVALGAASMKAFKDVDEGWDTIVEKTGATGEAAEKLEGVYKDIAGSMVGDFEDIGSAVGEVSTRFGVTGDDLEDLSKTFLQFSKINRTDVSTSVDRTQKALSAFGLNASDAGGLLDRLTKVSQDTGANVETLTDGLIQNGAAFQEMGLSIDQAAVFMGQMETSGANSETVMQGLRKALKNAAEDGVPLNEALANLQDTILNGTDGMDGLTASYDLFGKSGDQIYQAVKNGTLDFASLALAVGDVSGAVSDTYDATLDGSDKMALAWQNVQLALAELGDAVGEVLAPIMDKIVEGIQGFTEWFSNLDDGTKQTIVTIAGLVAAIGPLLVIGGKVMSGISSITGAISSMGSLSLGPIGIAIAAIAGLTAAGTALLDSWKNAYLDASPFTQALDELAQKNSDLNDAISTSKDNYDKSVEGAEAQAGAAENLTLKLQDLITEYDGSATKQAEIKTIVDQLNQLVPDLGLAWDDSTESLNMNTQQIYAQIAAMEAQAKVTALSDLYTDSLKEQYTAQKNLTEAQQIWEGVLAKQGMTEEEAHEWMVKLSSGTKDAASAIDLWLSSAGYFLENGTDTQGMAEELTNAFLGLTEAQKNMDEVTGNVTFAETELGNALQAAAEATQMSTQSIQDHFAALGVGLSEELNSAIVAAQNAGYKIPQTMAEGIQSGQIAEENAINRMNALVDFNTAINAADVAGVRVSTSFVNSWLSGEYPLEQATTYYNSIIQFTDAINTAKASGQEVTGAFVNQLRDQYNLYDVFTSAQELGEAAVPQVPQEEVQAVAQETTETLANELENSSSTATQAASEVADDVTDEFSGMPDEVGDYGTQAGEKLDTGFGSNSGSISSTLDDIWNLYYQVLGVLLPGKAWEWGYSIGGKLESGLNEGASGIGGTFTNIYYGIQNAAAYFQTAAWNAGGDIGSGLYYGLYSWYPYIVNLAYQLGQSALASVRSALGINSPSKRMMEVGQYVGEGLVIGLRSTENSITDEMASLAGIISGTDMGINALNAGAMQSNAAQQAQQAQTAETAGIVALLGEYLPYLAQQQSIVLDDGTLAGHMAPAMDEALQQLNIRANRG